MCLSSFGDVLYLLGPSSRQKVRVRVASSSKNSFANESHHKLSLSCTQTGKQKDQMTATGGQAVRIGDKDHRHLPLIGAAVVC